MSLGATIFTFKKAAHKRLGVANGKAEVNHDTGLFQPTRLILGPTNSTLPTSRFTYPQRDNQLTSTASIIQIILY